MDINIRHARAQDIQTVAEMCRELLMLHSEFSEFWTPSDNCLESYLDYMAKAEDDSERALLVAIHSDEVIGFIHGTLQTPPPPVENKTRGLITDLMVSPAVRRKGTGSELHAALLEWFRAQNANEVTLTMACKNEAAVAFWRKLGYNHITYTAHKLLS